MTRVAREDRNRKYDQRHDSQRNGRRETMERKEEARHTGQHSGNQKPSGPAVEALAGKQSEKNNESGKNSHKADQRVNYGVNA